MNLYTYCIEIINQHIGEFALKIIPDKYDIEAKLKKLCVTLHANIIIHNNSGDLSDAYFAEPPFFTTSIAITREHSLLYTRSQAYEFAEDNNDVYNFSKEKNRKEEEKNITRKCSECGKKCTNYKSLELSCLHTLDLPCLEKYLGSISSQFNKEDC